MKSRVSTYAIAGIALLFYGESHASRIWMFQNVFIEDVIYAHDRNNTAIRIVLNDTSQPIQPYSCAPTAQARVVSYWNSPTDLYMTTLVSVALAAQAQGLAVDIMIDSNSCSVGGNGWENDGGAPSGLGLKLQGIRVRGH